MTQEIKEEEFDIEDLRYYATLTPKQKLDYLEQMNLFLLKITPAEALAKNQKLKDSGY
ncbi:MAG: hypothetical protein J5J00_00885 [Deltaproteobacteria bacterium]|nr:hypothetical protein [Deltaproteobacteria bacterium]